MRRSVRFAALFTVTTGLHSFAAVAIAASTPPQAATLTSGASSGTYAPDLALVRTVAAPGGLSADMRAALQNLDALFSRSPETLRGPAGADRARALRLGG